MNHFEVHKRNINEVFNYTYNVPFYQRGYSWKKEEVSQFWDDIIMAFNENHQEYFLGSVVLKNGINTFEIIDGQQRISTLTIFLCAARDCFFNYGYEDNAMNIHTTYISERDLRLQETFRLTLSEVNKEVFQKYIQHPLDSTERKTIEDFNEKPASSKHMSNINLITAYQIFKEEIEDFLKQREDKKKNLLDLVEIVLNRFLIVNITVTNDVDAYIIFETLNDRGMELSTSDLLKNHIFSKASSFQLEEVRKKWSNLNDELTQMNLTVFLRHYWLANHQRVTEKKLYEKLKQHLNKSDVNVNEFMDDLLFMADIYVNIIEPKKNYWGDYEVVDSISNMVKLGYRASYSIILIGKKELNQENFLRLVKTCENFLFRYLTIGSNNPSDIEKFFDLIASKIRNKGNAAIEELVSMFVNQAASDEKFKADFENTSIKKGNLQRYILEKINNSMGTKENVINNAQQVHVEHIMPKKPNNIEWENIINASDEDFEQYINKIGNLTLLQKKLNQNASNKNFQEKKNNYYIYSEIKITKDLCDYTHWDFNQINARQKYLAEKAVKVWKF
ncbi:DUF262 domain-containing protein [Alkalicoccus chagannorensis]|uniref:DUF262 domain-containing protein n=1 Tax=Alkalicoccus chagannorensis TaxID=427072 RepID=UPI0003F5346F|nr:DUF262 domain-containing protein [Alkalicoccus chagannorensis]